MVRWEGKYSDQLLETIDWCLCINHLYRPKSVFALQKALTEAPTAKPARKPRSMKHAPGWAPRRQTQEERDDMKFTIYQESRQGKRKNNGTASPTAIRAMRPDGRGGRHGGHYYGEIASADRRADI